MKDRGNIMRIVLSAAVLISLVFAYACADPQRDNPNDPDAGNFKCIVKVSADSKYKTIHEGIGFAKSYCLDTLGLSSARVHVAGSESPGDIYEINWHDDINRIQMLDGVSIIGGYSSDFSIQNSDKFITVIKDISNGMTNSGNNNLNPNRAIYCDSTISTNTVIKGFTIKASSIAPQFSYNAAVFIEGSPTITECKIDNDIPTNDDTYSYAIIINNASPIITYNAIDPGGKSSTGRSYGIYVTNASSPTISNNIFIKGGLGDRTYGIYTNTGTLLPIITFNTIYSGNGPTESCGIYIRDGNSVINDNVFESEGLNARGIIEYNSPDSDPKTLNRNDFNFSGYWYRDYINPDTIDVEDSNWNDGNHDISTQEGTQPILYSLWGNYSTATSQP